MVPLLLGAVLQAPIAVPTHFGAVEIQSGATNVLLPISTMALAKAVFAIQCSVVFLLLATLASKALS